jgi:pimeloyl-ACP methyl ester carboxylesterase
MRKRVLIDDFWQVSLDLCTSESLAQVRQPSGASRWGIGFDSQVRANEDVFRALPASIHEAVVRAYIRGAYNRVLPEMDLIEYVRPWIGKVGQAAFYRQMSQFDLRYTDEVEPLYAKVRCPTLILRGEADQ